MDTKFYSDHKSLLKENFPDFNFEVYKADKEIQSYEHLNQEIVEIHIEKDGLENSFHMLEGRFDFTEEKKKENYIHVAERCVNELVEEAEALKLEEEEKAKAKGLEEHSNVEEEQ